MDLGEVGPSLGIFYAISFHKRQKVKIWKKVDAKCSHANVCLMILISEPPTQYWKQLVWWMKMPRKAIDRSEIFAMIT